MKRKVLTILLALCVALTMMPTAAMADTPTPDFNDGTWTALTADYLANEEINYTLAGGASESSAAHYYLNSDVTTDQTIHVTGHVILDINGHVLKYENADATGSVIKVGENANLILNDSDPSVAHEEETGLSSKGGVITGGTGIFMYDYYKFGGGVYIDENGTFTMNAGSIENCTADYGGGVEICKNGTFTMNGGSIENCTADYGGGVEICKNGTFTMNDGSIVECKMTDSDLSRGGSVQSKGIFTMIGGKIKDCELKQDVYRADISLYDGNMYANGGEIYGTTYISTKGKICSTVNSEKQTTFYFGVESRGEIASGRFKETVTNGFYYDGSLPAYGKISGGTFEGTVVNNAYESSGKFYQSEITGGKFLSTVTNAKKAIVSGGDFSAATLDGDGKIGTVSFELNGGQGDAPTQWRYNSTATEPETAPARAGYDFGGWYSNENKYEFESEVTGDLSLAAKWTVKDNYTVKFNTNGASSEAIADKTSVKWTDKLLDNITNPTKAGYRFVAWKYGDKAVTADTSYGELVADDSITRIELQAQWQKKSSGTTVQKPSVSLGTDAKTEKAADGSTIYTTAEGSIVISKDGRTAAITPADGYEVANVSVNGKNMGAVTTLTGLKTGDEIIVSFQKTEEAKKAEVKAAAAKLDPIARSVKTAKGNIKVTVKFDKETESLIKEMQELGYTVKYKFYRSTKKSSGYKAMLTKSGRSYTNTNGKAGTKYYYKARVQIYDKDGKLIAQTALKQCKYASRTWTK